MPFSEANYKVRFASEYSNQSVQAEFLVKTINAF